MFINEFEHRNKTCLSCTSRSGCQQTDGIYTEFKPSGKPTNERLNGVVGEIVRKRISPKQLRNGDSSFQWL